MRLSQSHVDATFMLINLDNLSSRFVPDHHHEALSDRRRSSLLPPRTSLPAQISNKPFFLRVQNSQRCATQPPFHLEPSAFVYSLGSASSNQVEHLASDSLTMTPAWRTAQRHPYWSVLLISAPCLSYSPMLGRAVLQYTNNAKPHNHRARAFS